MSEKTKYQLFDLIIGEDYQAGDGSQKTSWTRVGAVFRDNVTGTITGKITSGLSLSGSFVIKARDTQAKADGEAAELSSPA